MKTYELIMGVFYPKVEPPALYSEGVLYAAQNAADADSLGYKNDEGVAAVALVETEHKGKRVEGEKSPWSVGPCRLVPFERVELKTEYKLPGMLPLLSEWLVVDVEGRRRVVGAFSQEDAAGRHYAFTLDKRAKPRCLGLQKTFFLVSLIDPKEPSAETFHVDADTEGEATSLVGERYGSGVRIVQVKQINSGEELQTT